MCHLDASTFLTLLDIFLEETEHPKYWQLPICSLRIIGCIGHLQAVKVKIYSLTW